MSAQEIRKRIESEIIGIHEGTHAWRFREHMLPEPVRAELKDHAGNPYPVWVVLTEPGNGYSIIFDETELEYGLATAGVVVGTYASFMDALNAM